MNVQVMNGDRGEIQLERLPVRTIVQGKVHPGLGPGKQQALALRVFADGPDIRTFRDAVGDQGPALAIIARAVDEWAKIVELVAVHPREAVPGAWGAAFMMLIMLPSGRSLGGSVV